MALSADGIRIAGREDKSGRNHAMLLAGFVEAVMKEKNLAFNQLDAVAVSGGPGSYTGLRIGVSTAKGLCYATGKPLIAIPSLEAMAHHVIQNTTRVEPETVQNMLFCPMIDARRMEVFAAIYNHNLLNVRPIQADIVDHLSFLDFLQHQKVLFFGNGADKCKMTIQHPNAYFLENITTSADYMTVLAESAFECGNFKDVAYYEPFYLKDFVATIPTKNIFPSNSRTE